MDSYTKILSKFGVTIDEFIKSAIDEIIYLPENKLIDDLRNVIDDIEINKMVVVRGCGRKTSSQYIVNEFYKDVFNCEKPEIDKTNNYHPGKKCNEFENYAGEKLVNYQISHIWGMTKNPYAFTGLWNISLVPKMFDPFTGHETKGDIVKVFQPLFFEHSLKKAKSCVKIINEKNRIIRKRLNEWQGDNVKNLGKFDCNLAHYSSIINILQDSFREIPEQP
jgi:hypothetical protein